jgi:DHA3 family macrolide efflux protein-like MFS transporter
MIDESKDANAANVSREPGLMTSFLVVFAGQAVSLFGSELVQFALVWWLIQESGGSATTLAVASLVGLLPPVFLGPLAGALVDRWNRRGVMMAADGAIALATLALATLFALGVVQMWHVYVLMFVRALGWARCCWLRCRFLRFWPSTWEPQ